MSNSLWPYRLYSPSGSSVHGILQARILEWVASSFSRGSSQPKDQTRVFCISCIAGEFFNHWTVREARYNTYHDTIAIGSFFRMNEGWPLTPWCSLRFSSFSEYLECFCFHWILYCKYILGIQQRNHENIHKTYKNIHLWLFPRPWQLLILLRWCLKK